MAFHTPDPKLRALEQRNAQLRAQAFASMFRAVGHGVTRVVALVAGNPRRRVTSSMRSR